MFHTSPNLTMSVRHNIAMKQEVKPGDTVVLQGAIDASDLPSEVYDGRQFAVVKSEAIVAVKTDGAKW